MGLVHPLPPFPPGSEAVISGILLSSFLGPGGDVVAGATYTDLSGRTRQRVRSFYAILVMWAMYTAIREDGRGGSRVVRVDVQEVEEQMRVEG